MLTAITISTFGTVVLLVLGLAAKFCRGKVQKRTRRYLQTADVKATPVELEMRESFRDRVVAPLLGSLAGLASRFTPQKEVETVEDRLETAGRPWGLTAREFMGLRVISIALFAIAGFTAAGLIGASAASRMAFCTLLILIGFILPDCMLQRVIQKRQTAIRRVLADTLDLLTVSVEAGLSLAGAMQRVVEKFKNPLSAEMERVLEEIRVGKLRTEALRDLAQRAKVPELASFLAAVCQSDQLGTSIARVLRVQGEMLRSRRSQMAREAASKLPVKMIFPLVFLLFPALFVVVLAPGAMGVAKALAALK